MLTDAPPRLEVHDLTRRFDGKAVVDGVSLTLQPGGVTCLLGPSGCGKSTTLRMVAGVERPDDGAVWIDGAQMSGGGLHIPPEARNVGLMFQDFALFPHLTVAANVGFGLSGARKDKAARVADLLERVSMTHLAKSYPHALSGGEQQRVALARALAPRPKVMLMDEPFSGLDDRLRDGIRDDTLQVLKEEGTSVLLVTHEPQEALRMADHIALMRAGRIVQTARPYDMIHHPVDRQALAFFSDINVLHATAQNGIATTVFGGFACNGASNGAAVEIAIRPQHVRIDFDRKGHLPRATDQDGTPVLATVRRARYLGTESLVEFEIEGGAQEIRAKVRDVFLPPAGTVFWLTWPRKSCYVFTG